MLPKAKERSRDEPPQPEADANHFEPLVPWSKAGEAGADADAKGEAAKMFQKLFNEHAVNIRVSMGKYSYLVTNNHIVRS